MPHQYEKSVFTTEKKYQLKSECFMKFDLGNVTHYFIL